MNHLLVKSFLFLFEYKMKLLNTSFPMLPHYQTSRRHFVTIYTRILHPRELDTLLHYKSFKRRPQTASTPLTKPESTMNTTKANPTTTTTRAYKPRKTREATQADLDEGFWLCCQSRASCEGGPYYPKHKGMYLTPDSLRSLLEKRRRKNSKRKTEPDKHL